LFVNFGDRELEYIMPEVARMRAEGYCVEIYPEAAKMKKQFAYADAKCIPYVVIAGESEIANGTFTVKDMKTGVQTIKKR